MRATRIALAIFGLIGPAFLRAQEREDRTLLTQAQMTAIISEVSGERATHHVLELVPYQRGRLPEEYSRPYRESRVIAVLKAREAAGAIKLTPKPTGKR